MEFLPILVIRCPNYEMLIHSLDVLMIPETLV
jgi:hypothetical protein